MVIGRRLMPHPRNRRSLGTLFDRNPLSSGHGPAPHRHRMGGDCLRHPFSQGTMLHIKIQIGQDKRFKDGSMLRLDPEQAWRDGEEITVSAVLGAR